MPIHLLVYFYTCICIEMEPSIQSYPQVIHFRPKNWWITPFPFFASFWYNKWGKVGHCGESVRFLGEGGEFSLTEQNQAGTIR